MDTYETLRFERCDAVATLTLNRPDHLNAISPLMCEEMGALAKILDGDTDVRCLVVIGEGRSFSTGLDVDEGLSGLLEDWATRPMAELEELGLGLAGAFEWLTRMPFPSVAAVRGHAYGAGLQLALACDFRMFSDTARVGLIENRYGLIPDMGATFRLPRLVGDGRAREMILLGDIMDAEEAIQCGLTQHLVPDDELNSAAASFARRLAEQAPLAVRGARRALAGGWESSPAESLRQAVAEQARCLKSRDFTEARRALANGQSPRWQGR